MKCLQGPKHGMRATALRKYSAKLNHAIVRASHPKFGNAKRLRVLYEYQCEVLSIVRKRRNPLYKYTKQMPASPPVASPVTSPVGSPVTSPVASPVTSPVASSVMTPAAQTACFTGI
jgi:hypothetical protein